jgi:hypothetical protein
VTQVPTVKDLQNALLRELALELEPRGFRARVTQQAFWKNKGSAAWVVHVAFVRHETDVDATIDLGVRLASVQELLAGSGYGDGKGVSIGAELGNLIDGRPRRWTIRSQSDAKLAANDMSAELEKFAFQWFERHSDLAHVLGVLAANDSGSRLISPLPANRCLTVVALAALTMEESQARMVADQCRAFLLRRNDPQLRLFDQYATRILTH